MIFALWDVWRYVVACVGVRRLMVLSNEVLSQPLEPEMKRAGVLFRSSTCESRQESPGEGCTKKRIQCAKQMSWPNVTFPMTGLAVRVFCGCA